MKLDKPPIHNVIGFRPDAAARLITALAWAALILLPVRPAAADVAAQLSLDPGLYSVRSWMSVHGQTDTQPQLESLCVPADALRDPERIFNMPLTTHLVPAVVPKCTVSDLVVTPDRISYALDCGNRTTHVTGLVAKTRFDVLRDVQAKSGPSMQLQIHLEGTRIGTCDA